jgi:hypothetical protein
LADLALIRSADETSEGGNEGRRSSIFGNPETPSFKTVEKSSVVQTIVDNHNVEIAGQAEWHPFDFFLKDENGEVLGGLLGNIP